MSRPGRRSETEQYRRSSRRFLKRICAVCGQPIRPGRAQEHRECMKELERRDAETNKKGGGC